jgi:hypothetical protein
MASHEKSTDTVPIPALLVERAIALARAEAGLALVHTRRIAVRGISALLGTVVACAFAQLTLVLLVVWPVLAAHVPLINLLFGVLGSVAMAGAGAAFAVWAWAGIARERRSGEGHAARAAGAVSSGASGDDRSSSPAQLQARKAETPSETRAPAEPTLREYATRDQPRTDNLAERVTL